MGILLQSHEIHHCGQQVRRIQGLRHIHVRTAIRPDEAGGLLQQQLVIHTGELQQFLRIVKTIGIVIGDADNHGVLQLPLFLQLLQESGKHIVHQFGFDPGTVDFFMAVCALILRILLQGIVTQHFPVGVAQVGRTGNDEVEGLPLPEEQVTELRIVPEVNVGIQVILLIGIVLIGDIIPVAHGRLKHAPAIEGGGIVVEAQ